MLNDKRIEDLRKFCVRINARQIQYERCCKILREEESRFLQQ